MEGLEEVVMQVLELPLETPDCRDVNDRCYCSARNTFGPFRIRSLRALVSQDEMEYVLIRKHLLKSLGKHPLEMMAAQLENVKLEPERDATKMVAGEAADLSLTRCQRVLTLEREREREMWLADTSHCTALESSLDCIGEVSK